MPTNIVVRVLLGSAVLTGLGGCDGGDDSAPPATPIVLTMSPTSGPYGTEVTIEGEHFGDASSARRLSFDGVRNLSFVEWTDTRIRFRVPFPGRGTVSLLAPGGEVDAGEFVPDPIPWDVSRNLGSLPIAAELLPNGSVAAVMRTGASQANAVVVSAFDTGSVVFHDLGRTLDGFVLVDSFGVGGSRIEAFFASSASGLHHLAWPEGNEPSVGSVDANLRSPLAAGHDGIGSYLWAIGAVGTSDGPLLRLRPPAVPTDPWAQDLAIPLPFAIQNATRALRGAVAGDERLFVIWGESVGTVIDEMARPRLSVVDPEDASWTHTTLGADVDDSILASGIAIASDGTRTLASWCWSDRDFDPWDPVDPEVTADCVRDHYVGTDALDAPLNEDARLNVLDPAGLATVIGDETSGYLVHVPDGDGLPFSAWPARPVFLLYDATRGPVVIVEAAGTYVLRPTP